MKNLIALLILCFCTTCTTYDSAIIYHKNFNPGTHPLLRFNGFYSDTTGPRLLNIKGYTGKPVFFYSNGTTFSGIQNISDSNIPALAKNNTLQGAWGNYLIKGDSIQLEKFEKIENNFVRIILKGIISKNQIHWTSRKEHNESYQAIDYTILFHESSIKPDSTLNFTRTKKKYNQ